MGLFKKKEKSVDKSEKIEKKKDESIELIDLDTGTTTTIKEKKRENTILFVILITFILAVFLLPTLINLFKTNSIPFINNNVNKVTESGTTNGMLEIGKETGYMIAEKIRFYNFEKKGGNNINVIYLPDTEIKNVNSLNIFIELYNSSYNIIYRTKLDIEKTLQRKVQGSYTINLNDNLYREARYGKITIMDNEDFSNGSDNLTCTLNTKEEDYDISYKVTYTFGNNGLIKYNVNRTITKEESVIVEEENDELTEPIENEETREEITEETKEPTEDKTLTKYKKLFNDEAESIRKTNNTDLTLNDNSITYTIDLKEFDALSSNYKVLYNIGSLKRQISSIEQYNNWSCE